MLAACGGGGGDGEIPEVFSGYRTAPRQRLLAAAGQAETATASSSPPSPTRFMDWAEANYPAFFPAGPTDRQSGAFVYRYYAATQNYLGVAEGQVYVYGPLSGGTLLRVGSLSDFAPAMAADSRPATDREAARFLLQAQFSATRAEIARVRELGYDAWFDAEAARPPGITAWDWLESRGYTRIDGYGMYGQAHQLFFALWYQLMQSPAALRQRCALALSEFFVCTLFGVCSAWRAWVLCDYWDMLVANAFGNFRTLLEKVSLHSGTGQLLTIIGSQKADPATGRQPDENYAREVMQLFTIGLHELEPDGTEKLDAQGRRIETYGADDVTQLARVFTGYDLADVPTFKITQLGTTFDYPDISQARLPLQFHPERHSYEEVRFLGKVIPAGTDHRKALAMALDHLFAHPNVGPFFVRQMIQRLVTSAPSPAYVRRVAAVFADNGAGVRGDLRAVFKAILLDPEARGAGGLTSPTFGKLREPMVRWAQFARTFGVTSQRGSWKLNLDGQTPLVAPSVFNFFRPGYVPPGSALAERGATAPEFQITDEFSVADYVNLLRGAAANGFFAFAPDKPAFYVNQFTDTLLRSPEDGYDMTPAYTDERPLANDPAALVDHLNLVLAAGQLSTATCKLITDALLRNGFPWRGAPELEREGFLQMMSWAVTMVMSSPEYLVQK